MYLKTIPGYVQWMIFGLQLSCWIFIMKCLYLKINPLDLFSSLKIVFDYVPVTWHGDCISES